MALFLPVAPKFYRREVVPNETVSQMEIQSFLGALWKHWKPLMSCLAFTVLTLTGALFPNRANSLTVWGTGLLAIFFFGVSAYFAWKDEHNKLLELQSRLQTPDIQIAPSSIWWGTSNGFFTAWVVANLSNPVGPPTALIDWGVELETPQGSYLAEFPIVSLNNLEIPLNREGKIVMEPAMELRRRGISNVIPTGGIIDGWLQVVFRELPTNFDPNGCKLAISVHDVLTHKMHSITHPIKQSGPGLTIPGRQSIPPRL